MLIIGVGILLGHGNHKHSHGHGFKHKHKHSSHNHQHNHSHGGHHKHWSNLIKLHIAYDVLHHHNYQSSVYWHDKFMNVRTDLKLLWDDYNELESDYKLLKKQYNILIETKNSCEDEKLKLERME